MLNFRAAVAPVNRSPAQSLSYRIIPQPSWTAGRAHGKLFLTANSSMSVTHHPGHQDYERLHSKLSAILRICQQINSERDLGILLDLVAREATNLLEADRASIFLFDERKEKLWSKVALGSDEILHFDARTGIAGISATTGQVINVPNAYADPRFNPAIDGLTGYRTVNILAVP